MYLDSSLLVNQKKLEAIEKDITCPICQAIINDPYFCDKCQNNFCFVCRLHFVNAEIYDIVYMITNGGNFA